MVVPSMLMTCRAVPLHHALLCRSQIKRFAVADPALRAWVDGLSMLVARYWTEPSPLGVIELMCPNPRFKGEQPAACQPASWLLAS